jgi:hypothetical protein
VLLPSTQHQINFLDFSSPNLDRRSSWVIVDYTRQREGEAMSSTFCDVMDSENKYNISNIHLYPISFVGVRTKGVLNQRVNAA